MHRRVLLVSLALGAVALPAAPASAAGCDGADTTLTTLSVSAARDAVLCLVNAERAARGLNAVNQDDKLRAAADLHSLDMVAGGFFDHVNLLGEDPGDRITAAGYEWASYGENIAAGYRTPRKVMEGWMRSTGHCHNVLSPSFTELGVGISPVAATLPGMIGTWTQDFGRPEGVAAPSHDEAPSEGCPYQALAGPDGTIAAPAGRTPAGRTPAENVVPTVATPVLTLGLERVGRRLVASGVTTRSSVRLTVASRGHVIFSRRVPANAGRFRARLKGLPRSGRLVVRVRSGLLRVTRSTP
jgi:uncharacterized protein YkwD